MKLSTKGRYGLKAMFQLSLNQSNGPIPLKNIASKQNISEQYLEQIFSSLKKSGLVQSVRGAQGGYLLSKEPKDIKVSDIMYVLEGPIEIADCIEGVACDNIDCCATRLLWTKIKSSIDEVMEGITLQDIVDDYNKIKEKNEALTLKRSEQ